ncbi:MAG: hypothetical protein WDN69_22250 [Aliidongia sp.]
MIAPLIIPRSDVERGHALSRRLKRPRRLDCVSSFGEAQDNRGNDDGQGQNHNVLNLEKPVHLYRIHFLGAAGGVVHRHSAQLPTDAAAVKMGQRMLADRDQVRSLEIWHGNRLVHSEDRSSAPGVIEPRQLKEIT